MRATLDWKVIQENTPESLAYVGEMKRAFADLSRKEHFGRNHTSSKDIGVFEGVELIGGATLIEFADLRVDPALELHWRIGISQPGTRICRLWSKRRRGATALPKLFEAIHQESQPDTFLYGVLSMPLGFAVKQEELLSSHEGWLFAKRPLNDCNWALDAQPSSEGRRLLGVYHSLGAKVLGEMSGSSEDSSVRVVMGIERSQVDLSLRLKSYA